MVNKFLSCDLYMFNVLQFDFFDKNLLFKNIISFIFFQFKYFIFLLESGMQLFSKIYFIMRTFTFNLMYKIKKFYILTKKNNILNGFQLSMIFKNNQDIYVYIDFLRSLFVRFLFIYKQVFGIGFFLSSNFNYLKNIKQSFSYFKIFFNDLNFRVNSLMDSLLNRENFIYFYENIDIFYEFIIGIYNSEKKFKMFFSFLGFFIIKYKQFIKRYKLFVFYTVIM